MYILAEPLALLIRPIYEVIQNYGWTLVIVTLLINLLTIPLTIMSQKSNTKTQQLQPLIAELQRKYANDKEKLNTEMQKLYTKYQINPMAGCLPLIIRMLIIFGFIGVVYNPLKYLLQLSPDQIESVKAAITAATGTEVGRSVYQVQLCGMEGAKEAIMSFGKTPINFDFMGIDLTKMLKSNMGDITVWIIPVLAVIATVISSYVTKKLMSSASGANEQAAAMNNSMLFIMPVMTAYFTFIMPIGMSLYWFTSTVVNLIQQIITNKIMKKHQIPLTDSDIKKLNKSKKK
ncbi:MAG: YidC/Oxa1 family membrane protein insertase [Clostridia bacterium]